MREIVEKQLKACRFANLSNLNTDTGECYIPKYKKPVYEQNKCYLIKIPEYLINNPQSPYAVNWNSGTYPKYSYAKAFVTSILGNMILVDTLAYDYDNRVDLSETWTGWLPTNEVIQIFAF